MSCDISIKDVLFKWRCTILKYILFLKLVFTPCKAEQPLRGMELQENEAQKS